MSEQKIVPVVGIEKLYAAKLISDDDTGAEFDVPRYLAGVREIAITPNVNREPFYAENIEWLSESALESIEVEIDITDLTDEDEVFLLGHKIAAEGGVIKSTDDIAPDVALLFKANKGKGEYRYQTLYKGSFSISEDGARTKEGTPDYRSRNLVGRFAPLRYNKMYQYKVDSDSPNAPVDLDSTFFTDVIVPTEKIDDGGTGGGVEG